MTRDLPKHPKKWLWLWGAPLLVLAAIGILVTYTDQKDRVEASAFFVVAAWIVWTGRRIMSHPSSDARAYLVQLRHLRAVIAVQVLVAFSAMTFYLALGALSISLQPASGASTPAQEVLPSLLIVSLLTWLVPGLAWFGVTTRITQIEVAEVERQNTPTAH